MKFLGEFLRFVKRLLRRKRRDPVRVEHIPNEVEAVGSNPTVSLERRSKDIGRHPRSHLFVCKPGSQASRQDLGRFMKHGRQSSWYRMTVKARRSPEDD